MSATPFAVVVDSLAVMECGLLATVANRIVFKLSNPETTDLGIVLEP